MKIVCLPARFSSIRLPKSLNFLSGSYKILSQFTLPSHANNQSSIHVAYSQSFSRPVALVCVTDSLSIVKIINPFLLNPRKPPEFLSYPPDIDPNNTNGDSGDESLPEPSKRRRLSTSEVPTALASSSGPRRQQSQSALRRNPRAVSQHSWNLDLTSTLLPDLDICRALRKGDASITFVAMSPGSGKWLVGVGKRNLVSIWARAK
jgi:hypothetical protein